MDKPILPGLVAGMLTTISIVPQVIRPGSIKTFTQYRHAGGLSRYGAGHLSRPVPQADEHEHKG